MELTKDDLWIRTYGRLYQKLGSTTCEIPIGIYRTQESGTDADQDYYETSNEDEIDNNIDRLELRRKSEFKSQFSHVLYSPCWQRLKRPCTGSDSSSFTSAALTVTDDGADNTAKSGDIHAQLIERAEISNLVGSRMQSLGLPSTTSIECSEESESRSHLSFVIINPSCDLKIKERDIVYLIRPSPFSAKKSFERHNSRRKSALNNKSIDKDDFNTCSTSNQPHELQKAAVNVLAETTKHQRRRSSGKNTKY